MEDDYDTEKGGSRPATGGSRPATGGSRPGSGGSRPGSGNAGTSPNCYTHMTRSIGTSNPVEDLQQCDPGSRPGSGVVLAGWEEEKEVTGALEQGQMFDDKREEVGN